MLITNKKLHKKQNRYMRGQVILEFTFCMIVVMLMFYGVFMVMRWSAVDLAERRRAHEARFTGATDTPTQLETYFYKPIKMNAIWDGDWVY